MTPTEFKSWFEGFTEAFSGQPTKAQWARIKARVGEIDGKSVTERVFVDRWYPYIYKAWPTWTYLNSGACGGGISSLGYAGNAMGGYSATSAIPVSYDSAIAMNAAGRAEALSLSQGA